MFCFCVHCCSNIHATLHRVISIIVYAIPAQVGEVENVKLKQQTYSFIIKSHFIVCVKLHSLQVLGLTGQVQRVFDSGNLRIKFSRSHIWTICADAVVKVTDINYRGSI